MSVPDGVARAGERPGLIILAARLGLGLSLLPIVVLVAAIGGLGLLVLAASRLANRTSKSMIPTPHHGIVRSRARLTP